MSNRRSVGKGEILVSAVLVLCALTITSVVLWDYLAVGRSAPSVGWRIDPDEAQLALEGGHVVGNPAAQLEIVKFTDLECSYCASYIPILDSMVTHYGGRVSVRYRHFPIVTIHQYARAGAAAAECAAAQGHFESFYRLVMANQHDVGEVPWTEFAHRAGVADTARLQLCMSSDSALTNVDRDMEVGELVGVSATPTLVIGQETVVGITPLRELVEMIDRALYWSRNR